MGGNIGNNFGLNFVTSEQDLKDEFGLIPCSVVAARSIPDTANRRDEDRGPAGEQSVRGSTARTARERGWSAGNAGGGEGDYRPADE